MFYDWDLQLNARILTSNTYHLGIIKVVTVYLQNGLHVF